LPKVIAEDPATLSVPVMVVPPNTIDVDAPELIFNEPDEMVTLLPVTVDELVIESAPPDTTTLPRVSGARLERVPTPPDAIVNNPARVVVDEPVKNNVPAQLSEVDANDNIVDAPELILNVRPDAIEMVLPPVIGAVLPLIVTEPPDKVRLPKANDPPVLVKVPEPPPKKIGPSVVVAEPATLSAPPLSVIDVAPKLNDVDAPGAMVNVPPVSDTEAAPVTGAAVLLIVAVPPDTTKLPKANEPAVLVNAAVLPVPTLIGPSVVVEEPDTSIEPPESVIAVAPNDTVVEAPDTIFKAPPEILMVALPNTGALLPVTVILPPAIANGPSVVVPEFVTIKLPPVWLFIPPEPKVSEDEAAGLKVIVPPVKVTAALPIVLVPAVCAKINEPLLTVNEPV
jgi:hypothetical protein